jgi:hypothetical protein
MKAVLVTWDWPSGFGCRRPVASLAFQASMTATASRASAARTFVLEPALLLAFAGFLAFQRAAANERLLECIQAIADDPE